MAITATGQNAALQTNTTNTTTSTAAVDKTKLGKDDFMKLLLVQLQYQDPTSPMDSEKILTQTSQLASLESADNTKTALEKLSTAFSNTKEFSTVAAIGKTADLGSNAISHDEGASSTFEVYFPQDVKSGTVEILDSNGNVVGEMPMKDKDGNILGTSGTEVSAAGVYKFNWDGTLNNGTKAKSGVYHITASYKNASDTALTTRMGTYPIEAVRFDNGNTSVKVGSNYVALNQVKEIY